MARSQVLPVLLLAILACWSFSCFVAPQTPQTGPSDTVSPTLRGADPKAAAALGALVAAAPSAAWAGNSGYALLQLGWAIFIISLGPAVLFWVYFNKPELL
eukprot:CAMPEP_0114667052 /NCGR_PEP_ID=MMETSP0191-20121206/33668_1 /TAXON_ID=126664 /ORGANISM="Sorites sp." /LENGTH=100 /DNA_ID=CAMNT_0001916301 /DNA_START=53 /DNA_END=355 /DNA_ORIENTATION=+